MKIAIDLDDVLVDTMPSVLAFYNENYEPKLKLEDLPKYNYWGFLGKTREEANKKYFKYTDSEYFLTAEPIGGTKEAIQNLAKNNELYIITGRPLFTKKKTEEWVAKNFPNLFKEIHFTNDRLNNNDYTPYWGKPKAEICSEIGAEVLIDDLPEYINESDHLRVYLINRYYNQNAETPSHVLRVDSLADVIEDLSKTYV